MILEFTDNNFTISTSGIVVIDFWSPWCRPCNMLNPILKEVAEKNKDITIGKVNTVENPVITKQFSISAIPTIMFFKDGNLVKKLLGYVSEAELQQHINGLK